ncbi:MAG TPA: hypothetical protein VFO10_11720 [Oligoflexus sp.]|uniref:hypothetical protein n=1 Tax=Oligoflexus sp. TaxID=1971216 RepID=UPI002D8054E2|nr:hypothetical protein [Oligoflexus sp.]HET9237915.1 hypothetical protein [Oligoflexus sp.]
MMRQGRTLCVLLLLLSTALSCHGSGQEHLNQLEGDLRAAIQGPDDNCQKPRNIDPNLQIYLDDYVADAQAFGPDYFPLARLAEVRTLILVPYGSDELQNDKARMGLNRRVECYDGKRVFNIYIADPNTTPERHRLRGRNMLRHVIYHELAHTYFDHYNDDPDASSTEVGIMAAITDDRGLSDDEMEQRKFELFSPESDYLKHLPPRD